MYQVYKDWDVQSQFFLGSEMHHQTRTSRGRAHHCSQVNNTSQVPTTGHVDWNTFIRCCCDVALNLRKMRSLAGLPQRINTHTYICIQYSIIWYNILHFKYNIYRERLNMTLYHNIILHAVECYFRHICWNTHYPRIGWWEPILHPWFTWQCSPGEPW